MPVEIKEHDVALMIGMEATEGVAATITATDVLYATKVGFKKSAKGITRDFRTQARPNDVATQDVLEWWEWDAEVPYAYSGEAGTPSVLEKLFRLCGAMSTVVATTSVTYSRDTLAGFDSGTLEMRTPLADGTYDYRRRALGARGQLGFKIAVGEDIMFTAKGIGGYEDPDRVAVIVPGYGNQRTNLLGAPRPSLITAKTLNSKVLCLQSIEASNFFGYDVEWYENTCSARSQPRDSDQAPTLKIQIAEPDWNSEFNPFVYARRNTIQRMPFAFALGSVAGKRLAVNVTEVQPGEPTEIILPNKLRGVELTLAILHGQTIVET